ncbi:MAG: hypothetical protein GKR87_15000 [Kiritimatiellae bacterium]|nr:hypothetical protein [Kiritimatiellia bacterium]
MSHSIIVMAQDDLDVESLLNDLETDEVFSDNNGGDVEENVLEDTEGIEDLLSVEEESLPDQFDFDEVLPDETIVPDTEELVPNGVLDPEVLLEAPGISESVDEKQVEGKEEPVDTKLIDSVPQPENPRELKDQEMIRRKARELEGLKHGQIGYDQLKAGNYQGSLMAFEKAYRLISERSTKQKEVKRIRWGQAEASYQLALRAFSIEDIDEANALVKAALEYDPTHADGIRLLEKVERKVQQLEQVHREDPLNFQVARNLTKISERKIKEEIPSKPLGADIEPTEKLQYNEVIRRKTRELEGLKRLQKGYETLSQGKNELALQNFEEALKMISQRPSAEKDIRRIYWGQAEANYQLALHAFEVDEMEEVEEKAEKALTYDSDHKGA